ncbi:MAG: flagellar hook assembly protein FlgD [Spirochaetia bacterium]|jgi:flagellar basal-body rod modification protein FlgD
MDLNLTMSAQDMLQLNRDVDAFNKSISNSNAKKPNEGLDRNDFLKILITQLSHQDPTQPVEDKEFIAQMAQFSSLEQITNMNEGLSKVADLVARSQALNVLGSNVDVADGEATVSGIVDAVTAGDYPQILVNGRYYDFSQVQKIKRASGKE